MTVLQKIKPARAYPSVNAVHAMRIHIQQASPNGQLGQLALIPGVAYCIGTLPKGSFMLPAAKHVIAAFNGTTPALDVGTLATPAGFMPSAQIAPGAIGFAGMVQGPLMGFIADETPVYVKLTAPGNTVGEADLVLPFYVNMD